ncbi:MAG: T9SS type A sorting domain-containing protein [Ignavibacteria bacterium]
MTKFRLSALVLVIVSLVIILINVTGEKHDVVSETEKEGGDVPAEEWFEKQRAFPFDEIPQNKYLEAISYVKQMPVYDVMPLPWQLAGPTNIEGRITAIVIHPTNPQIVYIGTANGGAWKSTNFCASWVSVFDNQNTSSIGALAIDPVNANIIYCGTGESNSLRSYYPGTGMYKSTDAGATWVSIGLTNSYSFGNVVINPANTQIIYAAAVGSLRRKTTERGIYKSTNGGTSWFQSLYLSDSVGAIDVVMDPTNPNKLFAAMWERQRREDYVKYGGPMTALYVSTNAGTNWSIVNGGFPSNASDMGRISLDISTSNPLIVFALTAYANGNSRGLFKSIDGGSTWSLINSGAAGSSNYAWFNRAVKVNPTNANNVICAGLNMESSVNGGTGFSTIGASHVDQHSIAFAPSNTSFVVIGNDGGIDYSTNGGSSWSASTTLPITQFYAGDIDNNNPNTILGGAQDNGTNRTTGTVGGWQSIYGGDGFYCLVDYNNSQRVYASSQNGGLGRSTNGGASFLGATSGLDLTYSNWMVPYVMDKTDPLTLYCGTYKIHKSTNGMASWTAISPDLANGHVQNLGTITTVDVSKTDPNVIYCGTDDANVWVTTNGGGNWTKVNSGLPYRWVTRVTTHPTLANVCYVTLSGYKVDSTGAHVYKTTNYGASWSSISSNLPNAPVNDILVDPVFLSTLYLATDVGVMISTNDGADWSVYSTGIPSNVPCHDLTLHNGTRKLVVWTHGRSAFATNVPPLGITNTNEVPVSFSLWQNYPNPFNPETKIKYSLPGNNESNHEVSLNVFDITGRLVANLISGTQKTGVYEVSFSGISLSSGVYFYKLISGNFSETKKMIMVK